MIVQPPWKMTRRLATTMDLSGRNKQKKKQWITYLSNLEGAIA